MQEFAIVQSESRMRRVPRPIFKKLKPERVQEELKTMPGWKLLPNGKAIERLYQFTSDRAMANYAAFLSAHAGDVGQPMHLSMSGKTLTVKLFAPTRNGRVTALDVGVLSFARQLN